MKKINILLFLFLIISCKESHETESEQFEFSEKDIWSKNQYFQEGKYIFIDLNKMKELELGKTSEDDIYKLFGKDINVKLTYSKNPIPRKFKKNYLPVDRLILYFDAKGRVTELPNGKRHETFEKLSVTFYMYKDKLQFYSIRHRDAEADKLLDTSTEDVIEFEKISFGSMWPNQQCDRNFYDFKTLNLPKEKWFNSHIECEWEKPDFEKVLKDNGYYERL